MTDIDLRIFSTGTHAGPTCVIRPAAPWAGWTPFTILCGLLVHPSEGLSLIDGGYGLQDVERGCKSPSRGFNLITRPRVSERDTAVQQLRAAGYDPGDVRHIIVTHLHWDHAGGLLDFPGATVHVHEAEFTEAQRASMGYDSRQLVDVQRWMIHAVDGDPYLGFPTSHDLFRDGSVVLLPTPGHSVGHLAVLVRTSRESFLFVGDAFHQWSDLDENTRAWLFQWIARHNGQKWAESLQRIRALAAAEPCTILLPSHAFESLDEAPRQARRL